MIYKQHRTKYDTLLYIISHINKLLIHIPIRDDTTIGDIFSGPCMYHCSSNSSGRYYGVSITWHPHTHAHTHAHPYICIIC